MERVVYMLAALIFVITAAFVVAGLISPDFRDNSAGFIAAILGPLLTALGGLGGVLLNRGMKEAVRLESEQLGKEDRATKGVAK